MATACTTMASLAVNPCLHMHNQDLLMSKDALTAIQLSALWGLTSLHEGVRAGDRIARIEVPQAVHKVVAVLNGHVFQRKAAQPDAPHGCMPPVRPGQLSVLQAAPDKLHLRHAETMSCSSCCDCADMCQMSHLCGHYNNQEHAVALDKSTAAMERSADQLTESREGRPLQSQTIPQELLFRTSYG